MASFLIHYVTGERFLESLDQYKINCVDKNNFRLGNLIVDSLGMDNYDRDEKLNKKMITHFRNKEDGDKCIQIPNVDMFMKKYEYLVNKDYSALGYLFHLYTDKLFFEYLYDNVIDVLDKDMNSTNLKKDNSYIRVHKNNKIFKTNDFYSGSNIGGLYKDYSNMNKYLINKYNINFNYNDLKDFSLSYFTNSGIKEIDYNNINEVIDKMNNIIKECILKNESDLEVFDINDIDKFICNVVENFNNNYNNNIKRLVKSR